MVIGKRFVGCAVLGLLAAGCVPSGKYDAAVQSADDARAELQRVRSVDRTTIADLERQRLAQDDAIAELRAAVESERVAAALLERTVLTERATAADLQRRIDQGTVENGRLRAELKRLGMNADALLTEKGAIASELAESRARLEELRKAQAAAVAHARLYRDIALRLKKMVDASELSVVLRRGRIVLRLPNDVLFQSGQVDVRPEAQATLRQVAAVLRSLGDRHFEVAGHTDSVPIATARFPSNWELSTARGVQVVRFLIGQGVTPTALAATGYGEFDPVGVNDTPEGRSHNRRIEITVQTNVDELIAVPDSP